MDQIKHEKELVWVQILYLFVIPTLLLYFNIVPDRFRFLMLLGISILLLGIIRHEKWTYGDLALHKDFMKDMVPYFIFTVGGIGFLLWLSQITPNNPPREWWENVEFLLLFVPFSVLQELVFRGILMKMLVRAFSNPISIILLNTFVFTLIHILYLNAVFVLPMTFIAGVGFAWMYYKYPNLILISISHTILNFIAMTFGFFVAR